MNDTNSSNHTDPDYVVPISTMSNLARIALILGILSLCIVPLVIASLFVSPLMIAALALGIAAMVQVTYPKKSLAGKGMVLAGIILGGTSIVLFLMVVLSTAMLHTSKNDVDLSNIKTIAIAMFAYASEHNDVLPEHPRDITPDLYGNARDIFISPFHDPNTVLDRGDSDGTAVRYGSYVFLLCGESLDANDNSNAVLIYTAKTSDRQAKRSVCFLDGGGTSMEESEFRALLPPDVDVDALDGP